MCLCNIVNLESADFIKWQEKTPTEMIGVFVYFANPCKWLHIGCKIGYDLRNLEKVGCNKINKLQILNEVSI